MITIEQLEEAFGDNRKSFQTRDIDHDVVAISLLRERIPYEECKAIIAGAEHDAVYLCDVEKALPYLTEKDLEILVDCNVCFDSGLESLYIFV